MSLCDKCESRQWSATLEAGKRMWGWVYGERCKRDLEMPRTLCTEFRRRKAAGDGD